MSLVNSLHIHSNYSEECRSALIKELVKIEESWSSLDRSSIVPSSNNIILKILEQDPCNRTGIILGMDPYPNGSTGIPFQDPNYNKVQNKHIAANICRIYGLDVSQIDNFDLYNLVDEYQLFLLNAALTVPKPTPNVRSNSGQHFDMWCGFMKILLTYILRVSPKCMFVLIFGKSIHLQELTDYCIRESGSNAFKIVSYHPCIAGYFLSEKCNPFQEINSLLELHSLDPIKWYKGIAEYSNAEFPEVRIIEDKTTFSFLRETTNVKICDLNNYECLLGDLMKQVIIQVQDNNTTVTSLSKLYNKSLDLFKTQVAKIINTVTVPVTNTNVPEELQSCICGFTYCQNRVVIYLTDGDMLYHYSVPPLANDFYERFGTRQVMGTFSLEIDPKDRVPMNAYEMLIDIIFSTNIDYQMMEMCRQLLTKVKPINHGVEVIESVVDNIDCDDYDFNYLQTLTGIIVSSLKLSKSRLSYKLVGGKLPVVLTNCGTKLLLRNLQAKPEKSNRCPIINVLALKLLFRKNYDIAYAEALKDERLDVLDVIKKEDITTQSLFHLSIAAEATLTPRRFQELVEYINIEDSIESTIDEKIDNCSKELHFLNSLITDAKSPIQIRNKIKTQVTLLSDLTAAKDIINQMNKLLRLYRDNGADF